MTSPIRSVSIETAAAARRDADRALAPSFSASARARRSEAYSRKSPRWQCMASAYPSRPSSLRRTAVAMPTTARSAWNCANEVSRISRATSLPTCATRLTAMLYVGRKLDRSG